MKNRNMNPKYLMIALMSFWATLSFSQQTESSGGRREEILEKLEARRAAFITTRLDLTPEESSRFWPVYNEYSRKRMELRKSGRNYQNRQGIRNNTDPSREIDNQLELEEKEVALKRGYYDKFKELIPPSKLSKLESAEKEFNQEVLKKLRERRRR
jgi:hypothetical protein